MSESQKYRPLDSNELIRQVGIGNILAISGGRVTILVDDSEAESYEYGIELKVSNGYRVQIVLDWDDTYTVKRQFVRAGTVSDKGVVQGVYCDQIGEVAYQASCFRNVQFGSKVVA